MKDRGLFVVLEGGDYAGKGTQSIKLAQHILDLSEDSDVIITHEPTRRAREIKRKLAEDEDSYADAERMAELYVEDRIYHSTSFIRPNLERDAIIIGNRYHLSTLVYQSLQGVSLTKLTGMHIHPEIVAPDLVILLDIKPETGDRRAEFREEAPEKKFERKIFRDLVYQRYLDLVISETYQETFGWVDVVDGNGSVDEVSMHVNRSFDSVYKMWISQ